MTQILERGNIYFIYRPRVERTSASGVEDIQRFFIILSPHGTVRHRLIVVGRKKLPDIEDQHERNWAFVQKVTYHPAAAARFPAVRKAVLQDFRKLKALVGPLGDRRSA